MFLFFVGVFEMLVVTAWTKTVTKAKVLASGTITLINVFVWYYVLETIVSNISNPMLVIEYALGCAFGTMVGTYYLSKRSGSIKALKFFKRILGRISLMRGAKNQISNADVRVS